MPIPQIKDPLPHVVIDRTWSEVPLFTGAFSDAEKSLGYGMLEQWIPRIGNYISRRTGEDAFKSDGLVIICPTRSINRSRLNRLVDYVEKGGHVLVIDSPDSDGSTANSLLQPFGLSSNRNAIENQKGILSMQNHPANGNSAQEADSSKSSSNITQPDDSSDGKSQAVLELPLARSCEISGGEPLATWEGIPVLARARHGKGTVVAFGFGSLFSDEGMGSHWLPKPEPDVLKRYEVLYAILRAALPYKEYPNKKVRLR